MKVKVINVRSAYCGSKLYANDVKNWKEAYRRGMPLYRIKNGVGRLARNEYPYSRKYIRATLWREKEAEWNRLNDEMEASED